MTVIEWVLTGALATTGAAVMAWGPRVVHNAVARMQAAGWLDTEPDEPKAGESP